MLDPIIHPEVINRAIGDSPEGGEAKYHYALQALRKLGARFRPEVVWFSRHVRRIPCSVDAPRAYARWEADLYKRLAHEWARAQGYASARMGMPLDPLAGFAWMDGWMAYEVTREE